MNNSIVYVEGNIGAGKSTLLQAFEHDISCSGKVDIKLEPVREWVQGPAGNMLMKSATRADLSMAMQTLVMSSLLKQRGKNTENLLRVEERSIHTAHHVFHQVTLLCY